MSHPFLSQTTEDQKYIKFLNELNMKSNPQIIEILHHMSEEILKKYFLNNLLEFMRQMCFGDTTDHYRDERLKYFHNILMCCPRQIFTLFLGSIEEDVVFYLLQRCDNIWISLFVGLFELEFSFPNRSIDTNSNIDQWMSYLIENYDYDFIYNLMLGLIEKASNQDLPTRLRQRIFEYICTNKYFVYELVHRENSDDQADFNQHLSQMNEWMLNFAQLHELDSLREWTENDFQVDPEHPEVDAEAFVSRTFPSQHPLAPDCVYQCGICLSGPLESNEDGTTKIFRSMTCCPQQMCCHNCLVNQATTCNTPGSDFKNTEVFICPFARHETRFSPPNP